jgi:hypothetical protein
VLHDNLLQDCPSRFCSPSTTTHRESRFATVQPGVLWEGHFKLSNVPIIHGKNNNMNILKMVGLVKTYANLIDQKKKHRNEFGVQKPLA